MLEQRDVGKTVIANLMFVIVLFNVSWVVSLLNHETPSPVFFLLVVPYMLILLIRIRYKGSRLKVLLCVFISLVAFLFYMPLDASVFTITFMSCALLYNMRAWGNRDFEPSPQLIVVYTLVHLLLVYSINFVPYPETLQTRFVFSHILITVLFLMQLHMEGLDTRVISKLYKQRGDRELIRLVRLNNRAGFIFIAAVFTVSLLVVLIPSHIVPLFFRWLLSLRPGYGYHPDVLRLLYFDDFTIEIAKMRYDALVDVVGFGETANIIGRLLANIPIFVIITRVLFFGLVICASILIIKHIVRFAARKTKFKIDTDITVESSGGSLLDDIKVLIPGFHGKLHPIRKAYAKVVSKHISNGVPILKQDPTNIIAKKIHPKENIEELTAEYEIIRYGR